MPTLLRDLRYAVRLLARTPGFTLTAIVVLALGIGANAAVFTLVNRLLLAPMLGSEKPGQIVGIYSRDRDRPDTYRLFSYPNYQDVRQRAGAFSDVLAFDLTFLGLTDGETTRRTFGAMVSRNYFSTLGVELLAGRTFTEEEERPDSLAPVVVVSHEHWRRSGSDPAMVGKTIRINARPFTVIGITPRGFTGTAAAFSPEVWVPLGARSLVSTDFAGTGATRSLSDRRNHALMLVGRLKPGVTEAQAAAPLDALSRQLEGAFPAENRRQLLVTHTLSRVGISSDPASDLELAAPFVLLAAMAAVVLLVASLNLANMMLARGTGRRKEIAMRLALGARRGPIVRQLLTEGALLAGAGGAFGLLLAYWGVRLLLASLPVDLPITLAFDATPDLRIVLATVGFCSLSTIAFGLGPAWKLSRTSVVPQLKESAGDDERRGRFAGLGARNLLVGSQIACSLALLMLAGLFVRGAISAGSSDPGYRFDRQILASIDTGLAGYDEARAREVTWRVIDRLRALPGVKAASPASLVAFGNISERERVQRAGTDPLARENGRRAGTAALSYAVGTDYFRTLGVPLLRGRGFSEAEERQAGVPRVVVIDDVLARALFPGRDPIGQHVQIAPGTNDATAAPAAASGQQPRPAMPDPLEVVGVVPGLRHDLFDTSPVAHLYVPMGRAFRRSVHVHLQLASGGAAAERTMLQTVRREIRAVDEHLPVLGLYTLAEHRNRSMMYWVLAAAARMFTIFGAVAGFLAVIGLYAVKAYVVARRTREIGIRMALGSTPSQVIRLMLTEGAMLAAGGVAAGLLLGLLVGYFVRSMLYGVSFLDPLVLLVAPLLLVTSALAASYVPALRATKIEPTVALRTE